MNSLLSQSLAISATECSSGVTTTQTLSLWYFPFGRSLKVLFTFFLNLLSQFFSAWIISIIYFQVHSHFPCNSYSFMKPIKLFLVLKCSFTSDRNPRTWLKKISRSIGFCHINDRGWKWLQQWLGRGELKLSLSVYASHISVLLNASLKLSYCKRALDISSITASQSLDN